jgi:hypothetical protein
MEFYLEDIAIYASLNLHFMTLIYLAILPCKAAIDTLIYMEILNFLRLHYPKILMTVFKMHFYCLKDND